VSLTPRLQSCVNKLDITPSIIDHKSRDSGISVLNRAKSRISLTFTYPTLDSGLAYTEIMTFRYFAPPRNVGSTETDLLVAR